MKILCWDLETAGVNSFKSDLSVIVCFGFKWVGDKKAHVLTIDQFPGWFSRGKGLNDAGLLKAALKLMEEADILVGHFSDIFDRRFLQGRCAIHGLTPPPYTKQRDTWRIARTAFNFSSNRLGNLANMLNLPQKKHQKSRDEWPGWWIRALAGDSKAIAAMAKYCAQDVETVEQLYLRLLPFDLAHPRIVADRSKCGTCGGEVEYRGYAYVKESRYRRYVCLSCRKWGRENRAVK